MEPFETSIIAKQDAVTFVTYQVTMATGKPCKRILYVGFSCSHLKNEPDDLNLLLHKSDQQAKTKLSSKLKKNSVAWIQSYLKFSII